MNSIPQGWEAAALGDVCRVVSGATPKTGVAEYWGGEIPWITPNDLSKDRAQVVFRGERNLTGTGYASCPARTFPAGSVIVSSRAPIGYVAVAGAEMCTNQGCKTAVPPTFIDSRYLYWFLVQAKPDLEARASGTTFREISGRRFAETGFWWPGLDQQRRIVEILEDHLSRLDAADLLLRNGQQRVERWKRVRLDGLVRETASGTTRLGTLVERVEAGRSLGGSAPPAGPGDWGIIKVSAMTWGEFRSQENKKIPDDQADPRYEIRPGDVLVSRANTTAYVGAPVYVEQTPGQLLLSDKSLRLVPKEDVDGRWLATVLGARTSRGQVSRLATGTKDSMRNISQQSLLSVAVPKATRSQQAHVIQQAGLLEDTARALRREVDRAQLRGAALRRALLAAAFSGRLT